MKESSLGVFAAAEISRIVSRQPVGLITNTDAHHLPGKHWVAFYVDSEEFGYFFDSLARSRDIIPRTLSISLPRTVYIQTSMSSVCRVHCQQCMEIMHVTFYLSDQDTCHSSIF